jgi:signal transduction histidine kinase
VATAISNAVTRDQLAASRARVVAAADETRRHIQRDLHDGVQQRLVSLGLELRAAEQELPPHQIEAKRALGRVAEGMTGALDDIRELASGIHPAILSVGGLGPALKALARRSAVRVELEVHVQIRLPERVEVASYFVVSEALANVAKHARASVAHVDVETVGSLLHVSIRDDGLGGADPARGSGLIGLTDRVQALGGTLVVVSPPGRGTTMRVELPVGQV